VLVRGIGPALSGFNVTGALAQPVLGVFDSASTLIATDTGWGNPPVPGTSSVGATFRQATATDMSSAGAFALTPNSADCAMVLTLPPGKYTAEVSGLGNTTGVSLPEVYDLDASSPQTLLNISARCFVGTGGNVAISGFVIGGNKSAQLLIRGIGPALTAFGLQGTVAQTSIVLLDKGGTTIVSDTGWGNPLVAGTSAVAASYRLATAADMNSVGAFSLTPGSADSAMAVTLPPGQYTAELSGAAGATGTGLVEVYELSGP
ncbi:MAG TPA: hypothetical protein VN877_08150, partial [Opitutaceae bacterium]|nr:hypothetical protein [Opitutaceae bacterium]